MSSDSDTVEAVPTVLVVDGNMATWNWLERELRCICRFANAIPEGLETAGEWMPEVIAIAPHVREEDGIRWLWKFRERSSRSQIVVVSQEYNEADAQRALDAGAILYASKSDPLLLRTAIRYAASCAAPLLKPH